MGVRLTMLALRIFVYTVVALMLLPVLITFPVALTALPRISFPPIGLSLRWFASILSDQVLLQSIARSFWLALAAAIIAIIIALPCAFAIQRGRFRGRDFVETLITSPRMIPQIVLVLALLVYFEWIGLAEKFVGLVIAHLVITIPFAFRTLLVSVATADRRLEWSSEVLGATPVQTFLRILVPQLKTGLIASFIFTFILSFNNVTLALFLSGIGQRTLPVEMFTRMNVAGMTPVIPAISFVLALIGVMLFVILDRTIGVYRFLAARE
jgi:putative spermidine/putrescine transport system permease protein